MLDKVLYNLFDNSLRHGGSVSRIAMTRSMDGGDLLLEFSDDGQGVPADHKGSIFERGVGSNTGLGLFLSRAILGMTGIGISEVGRPGRGARFIIRVPPSRFRSAPALSSI
jgi:signal transduction histidine kinase